MIRRLLVGCVGLALLAAGAPVWAAAAADGIAVEQAWARASIGTMRPTAAFVTLVNRGGAPDKLVGAESPAAGMVQIHRTVTENGQSRMSPAGEITIVAGGRLAMKPGGVHIMLMRLKAPVAKGTKLPITLRFEKAGAVTVEADVLGPGARGLKK